MMVAWVAGAFLLLLLALAEQAGSFLWRDSGGDPRFYCPGCDLRYARYEVAFEGVRFCPRGHRVETLTQGFSWTLALISACVTFMLIGLVLVGTGAGARL